MEDVVRRFWVQKYKLPPNHPLWTGQAFASHLEEFFIDRMKDREDIQTRLLDHDMPPQLRSQLMEQLEAIDSLLSFDKDENEREHFDLLEAFWEWQEAHGHEVDLDITVSEVKAMGWRP